MQESWTSHLIWNPGWRIYSSGFSEWLTIIHIQIYTWPTQLGMLVFFYHAIMAVQLQIGATMAWWTMNSNLLENRPGPCANHQGQITSPNFQSSCQVIDFPRTCQKQGSTCGGGPFFLKGPLAVTGPLRRDTCAGCHKEEAHGLHGKCRGGLFVAKLVSDPWVIILGIHS